MARGTDCERVRLAPLLAVLKIAHPTEEEEAGLHLLRIALSDLRLLGMAHTKKDGEP